MAEENKNTKQPLGGIAVHEDLEVFGDRLLFPCRNSTRLAPKADEKAEPSCVHAGAQGISQGLSSLFVLTHQDPHHENSSVHCCHLSWAH